MKYELAVKARNDEWDDLGSFSSEDACVESMKHSVDNHFDSFYVDEYDCVVLGISRDDERFDRIFKAYRDGTIIEETGNGAIVGQIR